MSFVYHGTRFHFIKRVSMGYDIGNPDPYSEINLYVLRITDADRFKDGDRIICITPDRSFSHNFLYTFSNN